MPSHRVLVIDDTPAIHEDFRKVFEPPAALPEALDNTAAILFDDAPKASTDGARFLIDSAFQGSEGVEMVRKAVAAAEPYALAFVDMRMPPGMDGLATVRELWAVDPRVQIVICTAHSDRSWHDIRTELGPTDNLIILKKPFDHIEAQQLAHALARKWTLARENEAHLEELQARVAERTQRAQLAEDRFSLAFEASPHPQALLAADGIEFLEINPAFAQAFGFADRSQVPPEVARSFRRLEQEGVFARLVAGQTVDAHPFTFIRTPKDVREMRASARRLVIGGRACSIWLIEDVTEPHRLEKQLRQSQKMDAVGQLSAGIAHDFNNLLTIIRYYTEEQTQGAGAMGMMRIRDAVDRAAALTRQLLVFSRRQVTKPEQVNVSLALRPIHEMLGRIIPERIRLEWQADEALPLVTVDLANLEQAVMNLVINARDAIANAGTITLTMRRAVVPTLASEHHPKARVGSFVAIAVRDTGCGMPPDVLARLFEPFFTTKEAGKGTGLGLATVQSIAEQHQGWVEVASVPGKGSTFTMLIPAAEEATAVNAAPQPPTSEAGAKPAGGERILIVEDDPTVRAAACGIASMAGYRVTEAEDGPTALQRWQQAERGFDLLFTDLILPNGLNGIDLAEQLRGEKPELKVVFTTGYSQQLLQNGRARVAEAVLLKPYTIAEVTQKLRDVLSGQPPAIPARA